MKIWLSKYALTKGIYEIDVEIVDEFPDMVIEKGNSYSVPIHGKGKHWHFTKDEAIKAANQLRQKKIVSLRKQINKLESLTFQK